MATERIISWGQKEFLTGIGDEINLSGQLFYQARGWQPFDSSYTGLLVSVRQPTNIDSGQTKIDSNILAMAVRDSSYVYCLATNGDVYRVTQTATSATDVTVLRSDNSFTGSDGLVFYKPQAGTEYMYYWNGTQIGRWDISGSYPTGWTDNHFTGLQSTAYRPTNKFNGNVYYGNKDRIGMIYDNAGTAANNTNVLDFEANYTVYDIQNDGTYLVIAVNNGQETKIYFWDTFSPSWNKEWTITDQNPITSMQSIGDWIYGVGADGLYRFNFYSRPKKVRRNVFYPSAGNSQSKGVYENAFLWGGNGTDVISSYGQMKVDVPETMFTPFKVAISGQESGNTTAIFVVSETNVFVAYNGRLFRFTTGSYGTGTASNNSFTTNYFDLGDTYKITKVEIICSLTYSSADTYSVSILKSGDTSSPVSFEQETPTGSEEGVPQKISFYPASGEDECITDYLGLKFTLNASNATSYIYIRRINIYGERVNYSRTKIF